MSEDSFQSLPTSHDRRIAAEKARKDTACVNKAFVIQIIPMMSQIAQDYALQCREKKIKVEIRQNAQSLRFILTHTSGEERGLIGSLDFDRQNRLSFEQLSPSESGKRLRAPIGIVCDADNWSNDVYENLLQRVISDFDAFEEWIATKDV